jgi:hypothetical protein
VIPYEPIYYRDNWAEVTSCPWWYQYEPMIERQLEWRAQAAESIGQDWYRVAGTYPAEERKHLSIETSTEGAFLVNSQTGARKQLVQPRISGQGDSVASSVHADLPENEDDVDRVIKPVELETGPLVIADGRDDLAKAAASGYGRDLCPISHVNSPLWSLYGTWGYEGLMMLIATRPDLVKRACGRLLSKAIRGARENAALGCRVIWIEECLTDQISPSAYAELNVPVIRDLVDAIHELGMKAIYYFCGDPGGKWNEILSVGADALSLEESKKGFMIDIVEVAQFVNGRCALLGNLDAIGVIENGTDDQLRRAVRHQIEAGRVNGGRFIASLGSPVPPGVPASRVHLYCDLVHELSGQSC